MDRTELEAFARMKPIRIEVSPRDFMLMYDTANDPSEPNDALKQAAARYHSSCGRYITPEEMRKILGDPMQGVSLVGRIPTAAEQKAVSDYLTKELGDQVQGVSLIVPESKLEEELRKTKLN